MIPTPSKPAIQSIALTMIVAPRRQRAIKKIARDFARSDHVRVRATGELLTLESPTMIPEELHLYAAQVAAEATGADPETIHPHPRRWARLFRQLAV